MTAIVNRITGTLVRLVEGARQAFYCKSSPIAVVTAMGKSPTIRAWTRQKSID
jgi:hypothetical protein